MLELMENRELSYLAFCCYKITCFWSSFFFCKKRCFTPHKHYPPFCVSVWDAEALRRRRSAINTGDIRKVGCPQEDASSQQINKANMFCFVFKYNSKSRLFIIIIIISRNVRSRRSSCRTRLFWMGGVVFLWGFLMQLQEWNGEGGGWGVSFIFVGGGVIVIAVLN